jgi:hypothetical protein
LTGSFASDTFVRNKLAVSLMLGVNADDAASIADVVTCDRWPRFGRRSAGLATASCAALYADPGRPAIDGGLI